MVEQGGKSKIEGRRTRRLALVAALVSLCVFGAMARHVSARNAPQQAAPPEASEAPQSLHLWWAGRS